MSGPWEEYQDDEETQDEAGPWSEYAVEPQAPGQGEAFLRGGAQGVSAGFADEIYGGAQSIADDVMIGMGLRDDPNAPQPQFNEQGQLVNTEEINAHARQKYEQNRDSYRARDAAAREENPYTYGAGELGGAIGTVFIPGMGMVKAAQATKAAAGAGRLARLKNFASNAGRQLAPQMAQGGAMGAASGVGYSEAETVPEIAQDALEGFGMGVAAPVALKTAGGALKAAWRGAGEVGKTAMSVVGGVRKDVIDRYLANPERIRGAKDIESIYREVTGVVDNMANDLDAKKISYDEAKETLNGLSVQIRESAVDNKNEALERVKQAKDMLEASFGSQKQAMKEQATRLETDFRFNKQAATDEAMEGLKTARSQADEAFTGQKQSLQTQADPNNMNQAVADSLGTLKKKVLVGVEAAEDVLKTSGKSLNVQNLTKSLNGIKNSMSKDFSDSAKAAKAKIDNYISELEQYGDEIDLSDTRRFMRNMREDVDQWTAADGGFDDMFTRKIKSAQKAFDERLKTASPEYKKRMLDIADDTRVLDDASKLFGKETTRLSRLNALGKTTATVERRMLKRLSEKTGGELQAGIDSLLVAQRKLKDPAAMKKLRSEMPESQVIGQAEQKLTQAKRMETPAKATEIRSTLQNQPAMKVIKESLPEAAELNKAVNKLKAMKKAGQPSRIRNQILKSTEFAKAQSAQARMKKANELYRKFKSFSGEGSAESKLTAVSRGKIKATDQLRELSKLADKDFEGMVSAWADASAFERTAFNGSRNVNLWSILLYYGGAGLTGAITAGPVGAALGAALGGTMDRYGPALTKKVLDGIVGIKQVNEAALKKLDLPENIKAELIQGFRNAVVQQQAKPDKEKQQ